MKNETFTHETYFLSSYLKKKNAGFQIDPLFITYSLALMTIDEVNSISNKT